MNVIVSLLLLCSLDVMRCSSIIRKDQCHRNITCHYIILRGLQRMCMHEFFS